MTDRKHNIAPAHKDERAQGEAECSNRVCDYQLIAPHGWEFLLDNHLDTEHEDRADAVRHTAVLGEN